MSKITTHIWSLTTTALGCLVLATVAPASATTVDIFSSETFVTPFATTYDINVFGAAGAYMRADNFDGLNGPYESIHGGGNGAVTGGALYRDAGVPLTFIIGNTPEQGLGGGGGGSALYDSSGLLFAAGGGGGGGEDGNGLDASTTNSGTTTGDATPGTGGNGGGAGLSTYDVNRSGFIGGGGGGSGALGSGGTNLDYGGGTGGASRLNGGEQGAYSGGGGGGYSGGAGGGTSTVIVYFPFLIVTTGQGGGGGGSYNDLYTSFGTYAINTGGAFAQISYQTPTICLTCSGPPQPAPPTSPAPEPATWALILVGVGFAGATLRRRQTTVAA